MAETVFVGTSDLAALMRRIDWRETPVGAAEHWPQSVRAIVRLMLTSRYAMWMGWGPELTFFYNDAYARMTLGAKHPAALGTPASRVWAEIWSEIGPRIDHVLATGEATWDEGLLLFLERSGFREETYHTFSYSPLHQDDGRIAGMFCVVTEETTRLVGERRLALLRDFGSRLASSQTTADVWSAAGQSLANDSRDLPFTLAYLFTEAGTMATLAARGNVDANDPVAREQIDVDDRVWPIGRVLDGSGPRIRVVDLPPAMAWPRGPWDQAPRQAAVVALHQPGQTRPAGVFIAGLNPHRPVDAEFESFIALFVGQLEAGLANAQAYVNERLRAEALAQIDRAKTAFFSNVSHEFRTPLTLMLGPIEDRLRGAAGDGSQEWLAPVLRNGHRLQKLVNSLLEFSRIEAGREQASFEPTDLAQFTGDLTSLFRASVEKAGLRLLIDTPPLPEPVYVDRDKWEKIVLNLLSNAFKFTFEGEIAVTLAGAGDQVRLTVRDTGIGIPIAELPRIFERFHRVESARGRTYEGTGIGLALTAELVRMHGGRVTVESVEGHGTTFTVLIPRGTTHLPAERIHGGPLHAPASQSGHAFVNEAARWLPSESHDVMPRFAAIEGPADGSRGMPSPGARVLVADDNADMRDYLRRLLGARWQVTVCSNGRDALESIAADPPDLLITDVMMPEIDGFGLLAAVRANERTRDLPVMMLSARAGEESRVEGLHAGADDYVVKPFSARELVARVETQLLRGEMRTIEQAHRVRMAELFQQAPAAIAILSGPTHVFELANPIYLELIGGRSVVGKPIAEALPELKDQGILELMTQVFSSGVAHEGRSLRVMLVRREQAAPEETFFDFVYQPIRGGDGRVESIAVIAFDVTNLEKARRTAEAASRAKDEFLANLSHELRTPLNAVLGWTSMLLDGAVSEGASRRAIESIHRNAKVQQQLIGDILDVSNIIQGRLRLELKPTTVSAVLNAALESVQPALMAKNIALTVSGDVEAQLTADPDRLQQIVWNLLTNAAKFTPQHGQIAVQVERADGRVRIRVRDNGAGIEPEALPHVFQRFWQADASSTRTHTGLGLGLAIVRHLVELHGGVITAASGGRSQGAEFVVDLPAGASLH